MKVKLLILSLVMFNVLPAQHTITQFAPIVAYLEHSDTSDRGVIIINCGTGFFVTDSSETFIYLVTASHVATFMDNTSSITYLIGKDSSRTVKLYDLAGNNFKWTHHDEADVAALKLKHLEYIYKEFENHCFPITNIEKSLMAPERDTPITILGFPLRLGYKDKFSPISIVVNPASGLTRLPRFDNGIETILFMIDRPTIGGYSGAPIFQLPSAHSNSNFIMSIEAGGQPKIVGIVHGTMSDVTGGKLGALTPSRYIIETINKIK